tara:strand:- start:428 stop:1069 length:642 start_codon:yes stop_codon:yes gene_type:complete
MSDKEYFEAVQQFYEDRLKSQLKEKFRKCKGCQGDKQFIEKPGQLIYSCGKSSKSKDSKGDKCGHQMTINLARYLHYSEMKEDVNKVMDGSMDLSLFDEIFSKEEINKQNEIIKDNAKLFKKCKKPFSEQNQLKARVNVIKKTHKNRIQLKVEQNLLLHKFKNEEDFVKKQTLMKEYLQINKRIKEEYDELLTSNKPLNNFLVIEEGSVIKST